MQAFLELGTEEAAITMVNYYTAVTPQVWNTSLSVWSWYYLWYTASVWTVCGLGVFSVQVRNASVFIQYSNHKELKTDSALNQVHTNTHTLYALDILILWHHTAKVVCISQGCHFLNMYSWLSTQRAQAVLQAVSAVQDGGSPSSDPGALDLAPPPSPVLRIIIDNMFYPVTLDVLQQVQT